MIKAEQTYLSTYGTDHISSRHFVVRGNSYLEEGFSKNEYVLQVDYR